MLPNPDADVRFDDDASPWYTLCEVRSPDRRGLLHSLTAGIASAGADVHSAHLVTISGQPSTASSSRIANGHKLGDRGKEQVLDAIRGGVLPLPLLCSAVADDVLSPLRDAIDCLNDTVQVPVAVRSHNRARTGNRAFLRCHEPSRGQRRLHPVESDSPQKAESQAIREAHVKRMMRRVAIVGTVAAVLVLTSTAGAWALDPSIDINTKLKSANTTLGLNNLWIVIGAVLVIFMQAGFALVETGFCRAKHAAHVVSTNFAIFGLGFVGVLPRRVPDHVQRLQLPGLLRVRQGAEPGPADRLR